MIQDKSHTKPLSIHTISKIESIDKRSALYLKGGIFNITNVVLLLDLLTLRVSPLIIKCLVINQAERIRSQYD